MPTLALSLDAYVNEEELKQDETSDNRYRTDEYGLQNARKGIYLTMIGLRISKLPPVLMIQLKRFEYNPFLDANQKIKD